MQTHTRHQACLGGRPEVWSSDDCETARSQANAFARPRGVRSPTPDEAWTARTPIAPDERAAFRAPVTRYERATRVERGLAPDAALAPASRLRSGASRSGVRLSRTAFCPSGGGRFLSHFSLVLAQESRSGYTHTRTDPRPVSLTQTLRRCMIRVRPTAWGLEVHGAGQQHRRNRNGVHSSLGGHPRGKSHRMETARVWN